MSENKTEPKALTVKEEVLEKVTSTIRAYQTRGELQLPVNYSVENAMKSAWLMLQSIADRNGKPVLEACTRTSIINALMSMAIAGLNPDKKQCYFIAYGTALTLKRSYFGSILVAKRVDPKIDDIVYQAVYDGDVLEYEIVRGKRYITLHKQSQANIDKTKIVGAYAMPVYKDGSCGPAVYKTWADILQAWKASPISPVNADGSLKAGTTHEKYPAEMACRTAVEALCKPIINSSSDASLFAQTVRAMESEADEAAALADIDDNANTGPVVDIPPDAQATEGQQTMDMPGWAGGAK